MKVCATLAIVAVAAFAGSAKEKEDDRGKAALGERASRSGQPQPVRVRAADRAGKRELEVDLRRCFSLGAVCGDRPPGVAKLRRDGCMTSQSRRGRGERFDAARPMSHMGTIASS